jgi:hypothetical protein
MTYVLKCPNSSLLTPGEQRVKVATLRYALPILRTLREGVSFYNRHLIKMVGKDARSQKARHTAAENNGIRAARMPVEHALCPPSLVSNSNPWFFSFVL